MTTTRAEAIAHDLRTLIAEHGVPGVSVAWGTPDGIETAVAGTINIATGYPVLPTTHFLVGSITKTFTAVTAMRLAERGLLDLDAPIRRYLPDLAFGAPDEDAADVITLRMLLSHQSGVPSDNFEDFGRGDDCLARFAADLRRHRLAHQPATFFSYSNGGFSLVGRIIEAASGMVFDRALRAEVLAPLGLDSAGLLPEEVMLNSVAVGHEVEALPDGASTTRPFAWPRLRAIGPEGMLVIAPRDLVRYGLAIADPTASGLLGERTAVEMLAPQVTVPDWVHGPRSSWALGWHRPSWTEQAVAGHTGSIAGSSAALIIDLEDRAAFAVTVNSWGEGATATRRAVHELVAEAVGRASFRPMPEAPIEVAEPGDLAPFTGTYGQLNSEYRVTLQDGGLRLSATFGPCLAAEGVADFSDAPLLGVGANRFRVGSPDSPTTIAFHQRAGADRPEVMYPGASGAFRLP